MLSYQQCNCNVSHERQFCCFTHIDREDVRYAGPYFVEQPTVKLRQIRIAACQQDIGRHQTYLDLQLSLASTLVKRSESSKQLTAAVNDIRNFIIFDEEKCFQQYETNVRLSLIHAYANVPTLLTLQ